QGHLKSPRRTPRPGDVLAAISRRALLQIDTINVVPRSPYLGRFSRLGSSRQAWLVEALRRGELMEYWAHEPCFLPRRDFKLIR
ncbi:DNA glycosylase AlkZ-like family protein, partial [Salmonella enterica]|uniref:DNA glycosylase AlkZ-like family protein n=1 Tax=Salmonella enterica TaxID=28901 RepID=UPI000AA7B1FB